MVVLKHEITIDVDAPDWSSRLYLVQGTDNEITLHIQKGGEPYDLTDIGTAVLVSQPTRRGSMPAISTATITDAANGVAVVKVLRRAFEYPGIVKSQLKLYGSENSGQLSSTAFEIEVEKSTDKDYQPAEDEMSFIEQNMADVTAVTIAASDAADAANDSRSELTGAVGGALSTLNQQKEEALGELNEVTEMNRQHDLPAVTSVAERDSAYPNPKHGDTVTVNDLGEGLATVYKYVDNTVDTTAPSSGWIVTDRNKSATALAQLNQQLAEMYDSIRPPYDGIWSWWIYPLAQRITRQQDKTYFTYVDSVGGLWAASYDHAYDTWEKYRVADFEADDHNAPCMVMRNDGRLIIFYTRHNQDNQIRYRISSKSESVMSFGEEITIPMPGKVTYVQCYHEPNSRAMHLLCRVGSYQWYYLKTPAASSTTWEVNREVFSFGAGNQGYIKMTPTPSGNLRLAIGGHPITGAIHDIYYAYIDTIGGNIMQPGSVVKGNVWDGTNCPINVTTLHKVYDSVATGKKGRIFDIGANALEIVFAEFTDGTDGMYKYASYSGGKWTIRDICPSGDPIGYRTSVGYYGGVTLPNVGSGGVVYLAREEAGTWYIEKRVTTDGGVTWTTTQFASDSTKKLFRPVFALNGVESDKGLLWIRGDYADEVYTDYQTSIRLGSQ